MAAAMLHLCAAHAMAVVHSSRQPGRARTSFDYWITAGDTVLLCSIVLLHDCQWMTRQMAKILLLFMPVGNWSASAKFKIFT
jgi:hypothetical protein